MRRLTTPEHRFELGFDTSEILEMKITYRQNGVLILRKTLGEVRLDGNAVILDLTQTETRRFAPGTAEIQLRVLTIDGEALASDPISITVEDVFDNEVME